MDTGGGVLHFEDFDYVEKQLRKVVLFREAGLQAGATLCEGL